MKTLYWERATPPQTICHAYDQKALKAIENYFGPMPITLTREHLKVLQAMRDAGAGRPLDDFQNLIETHGSVRVWWDDVSHLPTQPYAVADGGLIVDSYTAYQSPLRGQTLGKKQ